MIRKILPLCILGNFDVPVLKLFSDHLIEVTFYFHINCCHWQNFALVVSCVEESYATQWLS